MIRGRIVRGAGLATLACTFIAAPAQAVTTTSGPVTYVTAKATIGEGGTDTISAECPTETSVSGGGGAWTTAPSVSGAVEIALLHPGDGIDLDGDPDDFYIAEGEVGPTAGSRTLRATAICLQPSDDPLALTYASNTSAIGAGNISGGGAANCGAGEVMGGGFDATADLEDVELEELSPGFDGKNLLADRIQSGYTKQGAAMNYTTYAMCSIDNLKHVYEADVVFGGKSTMKVACPSNRRVVGGGFGRYPVDVVASEPYDSKDSGKAPEDGWKMTIQATTTVPLAMYVWASCLKN